MKVEGEHIRSWILIPLLSLVLAVAAGHLQWQFKQREFFGAQSLVTASEKAALERAAHAAVANVAWAFADASTVKQILQDDFRRLNQVSDDNAFKARTLIRFAILDPSPDGRAALFAQACGVEPSVCDDRRGAALREVERRFVAPGNTLPLGMIVGGHPPVEGYP